MIELSRSDEPEVSIVMLVTREPAVVRPSLEALARALPDDVATELVVVLNTERDDTRALVFDGVRGGARDRVARQLRDRRGLERRVRGGARQVRRAHP